VEAFAECRFLSLHFLHLESSINELRKESEKMKISRIILIAVSCVVLSGCPLTMSTVSAPDINCKFDTDCTITVSDTVDHFTIGPAVGDAFLQSRTFPPGEAGTAAAGLYAFLYRIDLRQLAGVLALPCVTQLSVDFGPVERIDYDDNGSTEHVFVVTGGGLGSVAPTSVDKQGRIITFSFSPPVCAGASPGTGQSSFFFGLTSAKPPRHVTAEVKDTLGGTTTLDARAPEM
jgi:hypothetical protein